jgi:hypothetical protein
MGEISGPTSEPKGADGKEAAAKKGPSLPSISLPKVLDAIRGIGEKFAANPVTGTGSMTVPSHTSPGRSGFVPQLTLLAYPVAVVAVGGGVVATLGLGSAVKHTPTLFFCSIILSSWFGGVWAGVLASLLSAIALDYFFIPPLYALGIGLEEAPDMIIFVATALFVSWLGGKQKRAKDSLRQAGDKLDATVRERTVEAVLFDSEREFLANPPILCPREESFFFRQGEYWTIHYQGQIARLKATRGLRCLASLLGQPGREFHVSELIASVREGPAAFGAGSASGTSTEDENQMRSVRFQDAGPILDARAKAEYACRLAELREALDDAERLNDLELAARVQQERDCIADQLARAVGLGGRNRKAASHAERARSAVTKSIKNSIHKVAEAMPALGRHLGTRIKTGYFCSYNPHPDRPVWWELES